MIGRQLCRRCLVLLIYADAGTIPASIGPAYASVGLFSDRHAIPCCRKSGVTERFKDHYFVVPQSSSAMCDHARLSVYIAPEVGVMFLCTAVRGVPFRLAASTPRQTACSGP